MSATVSSAAQQIFKRIVVHNKLLDEATADKLLAKEPDPEKIIQFFVQNKKIKPELGQQLLGLYHKQLEKQAEADAAAALISSPPPKSTPAAAPHTAPDDLPLLQLDTDDEDEPAPSAPQKPPHAPPSTPTRSDSETKQNAVPAAPLSEKPASRGVRSHHRAHSGSRTGDQGVGRSHQVG